MDFENIRHQLSRLKFRGVKGTTGTQASYLQLFDGDHHKVDQLDRKVAEMMDFADRLPVTGQTYTVGGENEWENIRLVQELCSIMNRMQPRATGSYSDLITYVKDRPGHDRRYAIDCRKLRQELGWTQSVSFAEGLEKTVRWYLDNQDWMESVRSGAYRKWIADNYGGR